jgi:hypothetical protein
MSRGAIIDIKVADLSPKPTASNRSQNSPSFFRTTLQTTTNYPLQTPFRLRPPAMHTIRPHDPIFSFLLSRLLFEVSEGGVKTKVI